MVDCDNHWLGAVLLLVLDPEVVLGPWIPHDLEEYLGEYLEAVDREMIPDPEDLRELVVC